MDYFFSKKCNLGYIHSIDNLILTYYIEDLGNKGVDRFLKAVQQLKEDYNGPALNYWEKLDIDPSRKYSFYQHAVHLDDGIFLLIGSYKDYDRDKKEMYIFPMVKLEVNPNKHLHKSIFKELMTLIYSTCYDCSIIRYDYAIDIPVVPTDVQIFGSNKEKGLYKGTRYFGQRNKNGFCRIYDKAKEQGFDGSLTRIEHVISMTKTTKNISFEKIYIKAPADPGDKISKTDTVIIELCSLLKANEIEFDSILNKLDRRKKKSIYSQIDGNGYNLYEFNKEVHDSLLREVNEFFKVKEIKEDFVVDDNGFIDYVNSDLEVPFD